MLAPTLALAALQVISATEPPPAPTPEETLSLELVNRLRADPKGEARRLLPDLPRAPFEGFDEAMFLDEMDALEPAPPLVFHPRLIAASRNHAAYTAEHHEYGHHETPGRHGFTGESSGDRARFAGYPDAHGHAWENAGSFIHGGVWGNHWGCAVDDGPGGPGGMQARRGHRAMMMRPTVREYGAGFVFHADGRCDAAALFGEGRGARRVGGVCFFDLDGDGFYDLDEGVGGVRIAFARGDEVTSWDSGAYAHHAPESGPRAAWTARYYDLEFEGVLEAGEANAKIDFELLGPLRAHMDALAKKPHSARVAANLSFWRVAAPQVVSKDPLPEAEAASVASWRATRDAVLERLQEGSLGRDLDTPTFPRGSLPAIWIETAQDIAALGRAARALESWEGSARILERKVGTLTEEALELRAALTMPDLAGELDAVLARLARLQNDGH